MTTLRAANSVTPDSPRLVVIGGGPAGLTAAYEYQKLAPAADPVVFEAGEIVGGIARTESYKGFRFDIGGHRFFTKVPEVEAMWREVLGDDFITRPRLSRIFYRGKFYNYPLKLFNALRNIGAYESARIVASYIKWQMRPHKKEDSFEEWVINRFGGRLYMHFFRSYTEKVWGIHPNRIQADWAAQRIKSLSLHKAVWNALTGSNDSSSLIEEFEYPRLGPGMMWERTVEEIEKQGGEVRMRSAVRKVFREGSRITGIEVVDWSGDEERVYVETGDQFVNSMGLRDLIECVEPAPPPEIVEAARRLRYRDFLIVTLVLDTAEPFPDNWIYIHSDDVQVGRIQNFRAWSAEMVPNDHQASIGMEYFCQEGDGLWQMDRDALVALASGELERIGLARAVDVVDGTVIRQPKAYPVYDDAYKDAVDTIGGWIRTLDNLQTVGRNGLHRYNNQDHSMLTGIYAARNILGADHDLWSVNVERSYHETFQKPEGSPAAAAEDDSARGTTAAE